MTNKEIKLELAKVALTKCNFTTSETLTEGLKNLYEWVIEEPEVEVENEQKEDFDNIHIKRGAKHRSQNQCFSSGIATSLEGIFNNNNINTVDDLMRIGRRDFSKYRLVEKKSIWAIDDALYKLGIKGW